MATSTASIARPGRKRPDVSGSTSRKMPSAPPRRNATAKAPKAAKAPASPTSPAAVTANVRPEWAHDQPSTTVGVRELRQNLSVYLDRVKQGVALQVTEHGRVVAVLRPVPPNASRYDILLAQGLITPATRSIRDLPPPRKLPPGSRPISEILDEMRSEERY